MVFRPSEHELASFRSDGVLVDPLLRTVTLPSGEATRLEPKAMDLLLYLRTRGGAVVSKQELIDEVWEGKFVTEDVVTVSVYALRQAFGDDAKNARFIETVHRRGYRWIGAEDGEAGDEAQAAKGKGPSRVVVTVSAAAAVVVFAIMVIAGRPGEPDAPVPTMEGISELVRAHARAEFFAEHRTVPDLERAISEYERAIAVDSRFAEPHAGLAQACLTLGEWVGDADGRLEAKARAAATRAMELSPGLATSRAAAASVAFGYDRDFAEAEAGYRSALAIDPSMALVRRRLGLLYAATGRLDEAIAQGEAAIALTPTSSAAHTELGVMRMVQGQYSEAEDALHEALDLDPTNLDALLTLGFTLELAGRPDDSYAAYRRALDGLGFDASGLARFDEAFQERGLSGMHGEWLDSLEDESTKVPAFARAFIAARAGRMERCLSLLAESVEASEPASPWIAVHPAFADLHANEEFVALVGKAGLGGGDVRP